MNCLSPGGNIDIAAYRHSSLPDQVETLPLTCDVVGDNAYTPTEHLLLPFSRSEKEDSGKDSYNCHMSQLRIRIEMCFGRFVSKWRIATRIIYCCTRFHNYCINEGDVVVEIIPEDPKELLPEYYISQAFGLQGHSQMRKLILDIVNAEGLIRSPHNVSRNKY